MYLSIQAKAERTVEKDDDDNDSVTSEDFNDFLDKMGGKKASLLDEGNNQGVWNRREI